MAAFDPGEFQSTLARLSAAPAAPYVPPPPPRHGFFGELGRNFRSALVSPIQSAGQLAADTGLAEQDNAFQRYGQSVQQAKDRKSVV